MTVAPAYQPHPLIPNGVCADCRHYPCCCQLAPIRREPCACGGWITAADGERQIIEAVSRHNATAIHVQWAERAGLR